MTFETLERKGDPEAGDGVAFEEFFRAESRRLGKALFLLTGDIHEAEDLVQEAMARAFERWDRVARMAAPAGYVFTIAANLSRRRGRARLRERRLRRASETRREGDAGEARLQILEALRSLTHEQREALLMVEWLGLSAAEAGRHLGIAEASVRSRVHRARDSLRERMGGDDG